MTPNQIYAWPPISVTFDRWNLVGFEYACDIPDDMNTRVSVRHYVDECFDGERGMDLFSVWLDNRPFMIGQRAGRGNSDHEVDFITDREVYKEADLYLRSLLPPEERFVESQIDPDQDEPSLTLFYGKPVETYYNPAGVAPKYKVGDRVIGFVPEDHLVYRFEDKYREIATICRIDAVYPFNPTNTYRATQVRRCINPANKWDGKFKGPRYIDCEETPEGHGIGASLNDLKIMGYEKP